MLTWRDHLLRREWTFGWKQIQFILARATINLESWRSLFTAWSYHSIVWPRVIRFNEANVHLTSGTYGHTLLTWIRTNEKWHAHANMFTHIYKTWHVLNYYDTHLINLNSFLGLMLTSSSRLSKSSHIYKTWHVLNYHNTHLIYYIIFIQINQKKDL